ncbi:hypothetical protein ES705_39773 [subsurface metagenome]
MAEKQFEIIISGVGGQGNVSSGVILGEAVSSYDNKFAVMTCTYGTEARGTFAKSDILISDNFVAYYEALYPDIILVLSNKAYPKIKSRITEKTMVVINSNEVIDYDRDLGQVYSFPLSEMAFKIGSLQAVNIIALGFIVGKTKIVKKEALIKAIKNRYPGEKEMIGNMKAIEEGFKLV